MAVVILGIESSCDDTSVAVLVDGTILSNCVYSQKIHEQYGGVVPEVASREHIQKILPAVKQALNEASCKLNDLSAIAITCGPGLIGSLMVGVSFAKGLALSLNIPLIEVNHLEAHVLSHFAEEPKPNFPFINLTVSGGHTQIILVNSPREMNILGETLDDAAGEAFDKSGKLMGLPYPAGPHIDRLAKKGEDKFSFPEPKIGDLDFSFSGLKTSILYFLKKEIAKNPSFIDENLHDLCASIQSRIVSILLNKLFRASAEYNIRSLGIAGGVSANSALRATAQKTASEKGLKLFIPSFEYCTDNGGMIAIAGYFKYLEKNFVDLSVSPKARFPL